MERFHEEALSGGIGKKDRREGEEMSCVNYVGPTKRRNHVEGHVEPFARLLVCIE